MINSYKYVVKIKSIICRCSYTALLESFCEAENDKNKYVICPICNTIVMTVEKKK